MSAMDIQTWFALGMKREIPQLLLPANDLMYDIGTETAANVVPGCRVLPPGWRAPKLPIESGVVGAYFAHHFFEHLSGECAIEMLRECERTLVIGGTLNVVVPYYNSQMQAQDLTHKTVWCETTWKTLFENQYYSIDGPWELKVHGCFILGVVERNLALFTQLVKV